MMGLVAADFTNKEQTVVLEDKTVKHISRLKKNDGYMLPHVGQLAKKKRIADCVNALIHKP